MIELRQIHKSFGDLEVLKGVDLYVDQGEIVSISGPSGAGKSTLLQIMGTLDTPSSGSVRYNGLDVSSLKRRKLADFRNSHIGFIFQFHHLLPEFTALENVCIPAFIRGDERSAAERRAMELIDRLGLSQRATHKPNELSGGEQQRIAVARALINSPSLILADEPSGNLDSENALDLHQLFLQLRTELKQSFVIVTHNQKLAQLADRVLSMQDGQFIPS